MPPASPCTSGWASRGWASSTRWGSSTAAGWIPSSWRSCCERTELHRHHAFLALASHDRGAAGQQAEHAVVVAEHEGPELLGAPRHRRLQYRVEEDGAEPLPLPGILDHEGHLHHPGRVGGLVATHADQLGAGGGVVLRHDGQALLIVHVGEDLRVGRRQPLEHGEEALVGGMTAQAVEQRDEARGIVGPDGPEMRDRPFLERRVALELFRILSRSRHGGGTRLVLVQWLAPLSCDALRSNGDARGERWPSIRNNGSVGETSGLHAACRESACLT